MNVPRLLAEEEAGWGQLTAQLASIDDDRFEEATVTPEGWSPKDVMGHVALWMDDCAGVLERIAGGTWEGDVGASPAAIEATNREGFERSRSMTCHEIRAGFHEAHRRMLAAFVALDDVSPSAWEWFEESGPLHYVAHMADLTAWLGR